jgi:hypothetical protein
MKPDFHFTWVLFDWVEPWPGIGMYLHFYALIALALCIAAGLFYRVSAALFCVGFTYVFLLDQAKYLNHWYLICLISFLVIWVPAHRALSVDAWLRPRIRTEWAPAWALWLLRAQMGFVYFFGGIAKLNADWLDGRPLRYWLPGSLRLPLLDEVLAHDSIALFMSWSGMLFDLCVVPALLWRRTRRFAFAVALAFHLMNSQMFDIGVFPWLAIWCTLPFFDADWPRRVFNWPRRAEPPPSGPLDWDAPARAIAAFLTVYVAIQVAVPLRHFLYPGDLSWTEEGHRFAWHMKLRSKRALALFRLTDPQTGRTWTVDPSDDLSVRQTTKMAGDPFMIQQYAHRLADLSEAENGSRPQVRANVACSLNGHLPALLIDPTVDLAAVPRRLFGPHPWILPRGNTLGRGFPLARDESSARRRRSQSDASED